MDWHDLHQAQHYSTQGCKYLLCKAHTGPTTLMSRALGHFIKMFDSSSRRRWAQVNRITATVQ